jgi:dTDP-4-dehydrorhamnose 3,5-epimerase
VKFHPTSISGAHRVEIEPIADERGFFARTFCRREFAAAGLATDFVQSSVSFNPTAGTLRGLHYQAAPHEETKLLWVTRGRLWDVLVDLRPDSPTYRGHAAFTLAADERAALYVPPGVAHGFLTLEPDTEVFYQISEFFHAEAARGVRWDDPAFGIRWPSAPVLMSERDRSYPDFEGRA